MIQLCSKVKTTDRLKPLAKSDHSGGSEHGDPLNDAHGRDSSVAIGAGSVVQADGSKGGESLSCQRGKTTFDDHFEVEPAKAEPGKPDGDIAALGASEQKKAEADELTDDGGPTGTGYTQIKGEDQQRVQGNIQNGTADDADHGIIGAALEAKLII